MTELGEEIKGKSVGEGDERLGKGETKVRGMGDVCFSHFSFYNQEICLLYVIFSCLIGNRSEGRGK